jgi:hypothetical protein
VGEPCKPSFDPAQDQRVGLGGAAFDQKQAELGRVAGGFAARQDAVHDAIGQVMIAIADPAFFAGDPPRTGLILAGPCADLQGIAAGADFRHADRGADRAGGQPGQPFGLLR